MLPPPVKNIKKNPFSPYVEKLVRAGLAEAGEPLLGAGGEALAGKGGQDPPPLEIPGGTAATLPDGRPASFVWNRKDPLTVVLENVGVRLGRRAIIHARPAEPYRSILLHLAAISGGVIQPRDFETRIFLTDLPVLREFTETALQAALKGRRGVIVPGGGIVATAKKDLETAFVIYSAACFALFVKFFSDLPAQRQGGGPGGEGRAVLAQIVAQLEAADNSFYSDHLGQSNHMVSREGRRHSPDAAQHLHCGPCDDEGTIRAAMTAAGRETVATGLVNANFGNISYRRGNKLFITRRGSALDDLADDIVAVPLPGPGETDALASIELPAHRRIVLETPYRAVLHGHPKFSVIMSMACSEDDCPQQGDCHRFCPRKRRIGDIPVVSGEAGAGAYGLAHTVPPAVRECGAAIVYGHGVFAAGREDFSEAFAHLSQVEKTCKEIILKMIGL